jgi:hypothetical protein
MGGTKNCAGPWTWGGGRGRVWEGRWGLYKGPQRPPASRISSPTAARTRVQPYIGLFPLDACLRPLQRGGRGQGYRVPTARVITPRARVESQRGELRKGTGMRPRVSGLAIYRLFPPKACLCPLQRGGRGQGRAPVGAARAAMGGGGRASLARPPWRWRGNHALLELLLCLHATHLAVMGKKGGGEQAVRALSGVPNDSVACDNLVWLY